MTRVAQSEMTIISSKQATSPVRRAKRKSIRRTLTRIACLVAALFAPRKSAASQPNATDQPNPTVEPPASGGARRRSDFTLGGDGSVLFGHARGFFVFGAGMSAGAWVGVAFNDYFAFELGGAGVNLWGAGLKMSGGIGFARLEGFPLLDLGGPWQDLGAFSEFGLGSLNIYQGGPKVAAGGAMSFLSFGVFFEFRLGRFVGGPSAGFSYAYSDSLTTTGGLFGLRAAFYGGP
jgi:hypothetical protein